MHYKTKKNSIGDLYICLNLKTIEMKITIDEKACLKHKMTLSELLLALSVRTVQNIEEVFANMVEREILVVHDGKYMVTQHWSDVLDEIMADSGGCTKSDEEIRALAKKMISLYPHGAMLDKRSGKPTTYYFQCNVAEVSAKLKSFFARYGEYPEEELLDAEKRYVARWNGNYQQMGFRQLKYFIFKKDKDTSEITSPLLDFLENKESDEELVEVNTDDFMSKMI
jgi:HEPN domain-containing protein